MRILLSIISVLFFTTQSFSQQDSINKLRSHYFYLEIGGPSTIASLNYEIAILQFNRIDINARIGLGATRIKDFNLKTNPDYTVPIGLNGTLKLLKKNNRILKAELMAGNTISSHIRVDSEYKALREFNNHGFISFGPSYTFAKGLYARINYHLILDNYETLFHWGGLSLGYTFK